MTSFPSLPTSWSDLTWQQLCQVWDVKQRYGGNANIARAAALLRLVSGSKFQVSSGGTDEKTGEKIYLVRPETWNLKPETREAFAITPRELSWLASQALPWFDYPYGDPGKEAVKDEKGNVIEEAVAPVRGYVSNMRDAMILPSDYIVVSAAQVVMPTHRHNVITEWFQHRFALPQAACSNLTWQQYRALQNITPQLWQEDLTEEQFLDLQAEFLAHILVPRSFALLDTYGGSIRIRPHYEYRYNAEQAEELVKWWRKQLKNNAQCSTLYHICFQTYQTALSYYAASYPLLFQDSGKEDPLKDALTGEVGTINTIMKYAGYAEQQQVYDSNLPFVLDILNTMTKEAKQVEEMNRKIKRKR